MGALRRHPREGRKALDKERPKTEAVKPTTRGSRRSQDRQGQASEARAAIADHQFEQAEAIALEVKSWNLSYGLFEDNPDKVAAAARALRRRDGIRNAAPRAGQPGRLRHPGPGVATADDGRTRRRRGQGTQAQRMNVVPSLTDDRAEAVLHDIAMARTGKAPATPAAESPSPAAEREANELLEKGHRPRPSPSSPRSSGCGVRKRARPRRSTPPAEGGRREPGAEPILTPDRRGRGGGPVRRSRAAAGGPGR